MHSRDSEDGVRIRLLKSLTTAKVGILWYNSCWQSNSSGNAGIKLSFGDNARKESIRITRRQFTVDDKNSTFDRENRVETLTFAVKCSQFTSRDDKTSFSAKLRWNVDNSLLTTRIPLSIAKIASKRWHSPYNVDNLLSLTIMRLSARNCDKMSINHFLDLARQKFRFVHRNCRLRTDLCKNRVATTSLTRDITSADANSTKQLNSRLYRFSRNNGVAQLSHYNSRRLSTNSAK